MTSADVKCGAGVAAPLGFTVEVVCLLLPLWPLLVVVVLAEGAIITFGLFKIPW